MNLGLGEEGTVETKRCSDRRHNLGNQSVEVGVSGALNVQVTTADIVDGFVVNLELVDLGDAIP